MIIASNNKNDRRMIYMMGFLFGLFSVGFVNVWIGKLNEEEKQLHDFLEEFEKQRKRDMEELQRYL
jgi:hypothetical protein